MQSVDFLPDEIRRRRARRKRLTHQVQLVVACAVALGLLAYLRHGRVQEARGQLAMLAERTGRAQEQRELLEQLNGQRTELLLKKQVDADLGSCVSALDVLAVVTQLTPEQIALRSLKLETVEIQKEAEPERRSGSGDLQVALGAEPKKVTVKRLRLQITGLAPSDVDVANFIAALAGNPLLESIKMGYARDVKFRQRRGREFLVSCYVAR